MTVLINKCTKCDLEVEKNIKQCPSCGVMISEFIQCIEEACKEYFPSSRNNCPNCGGASLFDYEYWTEERYGLNWKVSNNETASKTNEKKSGGVKGGWLFLFAIILIAFGLISTKPNPDALKIKIASEINQYYSLNALQKNDDILETLTKLGCTVYSRECASLIDKAITIGTKDYIVAKIAGVRITGDPEVKAFIGIFNEWYFIDVSD